MIRLLFLLILIGISFQIVRLKGSKKLPWFFAGILFFPQTIVFLEKPTFTFHRLIILVFLLSSFGDVSKLWKEFKAYPLKVPTLIVLASLVCICLADSHAGIFASGFRLFFIFVENFLICFLVYFYVRTAQESLSLYRILITFFLFFTLYGLVNYLTGISEYNQIISKGFNTIDFANKYNLSGRDRSRISSFAWHPIYYGLLLGAVILLNIFLLNLKRFVTYRKYLYIFSLMLLTANLFLTNSRTPLVATVLGLTVYIMFGFRLGQRIKLIFAGIVVLIGVANLVPSAAKIWEQTINTFTSKGASIEGSSIEMREMQMNASLVLFYAKPVFGHGFNYISEGMGYASDDSNKTDSSFAGFESYVYKLLIEQGAFGILSNLYFFFSLFIILFSYRQNKSKAVKSVKYFSIGVVCMFLVFIIGTGDMGSFIFIMSLLGVNIKLLNILTREEKMVKKQFPTTAH